MTLAERTLFDLIKDLSKQKGHCFAMNDYLARKCGLSERQVSRLINKLKAEKILTVVFDSNVSRFRYISVNQPAQAEIIPLPRQDVHPPRQNVQPLYKGVDITRELLKKERPPPRTYDEIITEYTKDLTLRQSLGEFLQVRKMKRKMPTNAALLLLLSELDRLSGGDVVSQCAIVRQSVMRGLDAFYALKEKPGGRQQGEGVFEQLARVCGGGE